MWNPIQFVKEAREELRQVHWPTRKEALYLTGLVLAFTFFLAFFLGAFDLSFAYLLRVFVVRS